MFTGERDGPRLEREPGSSQILKMPKPSSVYITWNRKLGALHRIDGEYSVWPRFTMIQLAFFQELFRLLKRRQ